MSLNITKEIEILKTMTVGQLREKYHEVFGEATNSRHTQYLIKRIAWRLQANEEGDISERAKRRAMEIANCSDLRVRMPKEILIQDTPKKKCKDNLMPGMVLTREYKGKTIIVTVLEKGFEYDGIVYRSLTGVADAATGTHWSGKAFFKKALQGVVNAR